MRKLSVNIYLVKADEREEIRSAALHVLRGLNYDIVYTPPFAMCTDSLSEILLATQARITETVSAMRFSCNGLFPKKDLFDMREAMNEECRNLPETIGLWRTRLPHYFEKAAAKGNLALRRSFKEISCREGNRFTMLIINNDIMPMLELVTSQELDEMEVARPGEVIHFRYEVAIYGRKLMNWRIMHAQIFKKDNCRSHA